MHTVPIPIHPCCMLTMVMMPDHRCMPPLISMQHFRTNIFELIKLSRLPKHWNFMHVHRDFVM